MAKELLGGYAEAELVARVSAECKLNYGCTKSHMIIVLLTEALDARDAARKKITANAAR